LPRMMAPSSFNRLTISASAASTAPRRWGNPPVVCIPLTKKASFMLMGTPHSRPRAFPSCSSRSRSSASRLASSNRVSTTARMWGFTRSMCRIYPSTASAEVISPARIFSAKVEASMSNNSVIGSPPNSALLPRHQSIDRPGRWRKRFHTDAPPEPRWSTAADLQPRRIFLSVYIFILVRRPKNSFRNRLKAADRHRYVKKWTKARSSGIACFFDF